MLETLQICAFFCRVVSPAASDDDDDVDAVDDAVVSKRRDARVDDGVSSCSACDIVSNNVFLNNIYL